MIPASAEYQAYEALIIGATPVVRATFLPYFWPNGVNADGDFVHCAFVGPGRIQADYEGFSGGSWVSPILTSNMQVPTSPATITWNWNSPGFDIVFSWRSAISLVDLAAAVWAPVANGGIIQIAPYYQFMLTIEGYRAWAVDAPGDADDFTAWAEDTPLEDEYQGFAADENVPGDLLTYIEDVALEGEFTLTRDIEQAGSVTQEAPTAFDDLVAGDHSGLLLNNRQGAFDEALEWTPAPLFSPNKSTFFLTSQDWYGIQLKIELGWSKGGFLEAPFVEAPMFEEEFTDFITLFLGKVTKWGPVQRAVDQDGKFEPNTVEVYAKDWIAEALQKRICLPAADGTPAPLTFGEFLCKAEAVSGWSPAPILRSAYFEQNNYEELDGILALNGGVVSLVTPGITGVRAFQAETNGASQTALARIIMPYEGEIFVTGSMRFKTVPTSPANLNMAFLEIVEASASVDCIVKIHQTGAIYTSFNELSRFNIMAYLDVPLSFALYLAPTNPGYAKLWVNGEEIATYAGDFSGEHPIEIRFGAQTDVTPETWVVQFDDIDVRTKYYMNAYKVEGGPFADIGAVYVHNVGQPDTQTVGGYTQTLYRFPDWGIIQLDNPDPDFKPSGEVMFRVIEYAGGRHALEIIESLLAAAGLTDYIDATAMTAAYVAVPDDIINARFEGSQKDKKGFGLQDMASMGLAVGDALKEIQSRMLYWIFTDAGKIKIIPYTGIPPTSPAMALTASNLRECSQTIDLDSINAFVSAIYGWYDRNPTLWYLAGTQEAGGQGTGLDFTWNAPVACESRDVVKAKADLLLKFLSAQERLEPVRMNLAGARLELMESVSVTDILLNDAGENYWVARKKIGLDPGSRETTLQLMRFLGE